jgi:hypothetical protein
VTAEQSSARLYFLRDRDQPFFKIGISKDIIQRVRQLRERIDLSASFYVDCSKRPRSVEQAIHLMFSEMRIASKPSGDGCTEWFSVDCLESVRQFVASHKTLLGVSDFQPVEALSFTVQVAVPVPPAAVTAAVQAALQEPSDRNENLREKKRIAKERYEAEELKGMAERLATMPADQVRKHIERMIEIERMDYRVRKCVKIIGWVLNDDGSLALTFSPEDTAAIKSWDESNRGRGSPYARCKHLVQTIQFIRYLTGNRRIQFRSSEGD